MMDAPKLRKLTSPPALLGLFLLDFLLALTLVVLHEGQPRSLLAVSLVTMGMLGILMANGMALRVRQANDALGEGERYIESVAELSQDLHAILDARTRECLYMSPAVKDLLGYDPERFLSGGLDALLDLVHPMDHAQVRIQWEGILEAAAPGQGETVQEQVYRIRHAGEIWRWFRDRRRVFERGLDGRPSEVLVVITDVTETRDREAALVQARKQESLGALARGTVHDLNNLLMGIQGLCEIALEKDRAGDRETLLQVQQDTVRASVLCQQMLSYSGQGRLQILPHQLNDSIRDSLALLESLVPEGGQLDLELEQDLPLVKADPGRIRYVLLNLVFNSAEALGDGTGRILVRTQLRHLKAGDVPQAPGLQGDHVALEVVDPGRGLSPQALGQIFDPFFSTHFPGMGLGLFAVQGILREHHGGIRVQEAEGEGIRTTLYFPLADRGPVVDEGDEGTPILGTCGVILLVDDEPTIRSILRQGFELAGFKVIEAVDGVEGFGAFVRHRSSISAVLLDLTMPRMNGDEVFREIRKIAPEVPVVLMSGYSKQDATAQLEGLGLAGFIHKPCSIKDALAELSRALANRVRA